MRLIIIACFSWMILGCNNRTQGIDTDNEKDIRIEWINRDDSTYLSFEYNPFGLLEKEILFMSGQKVYVKIYHVNGNLHGYTIYHNGKIIGFNSYYINGQKCTDEHYGLNGKRNGSYIMYDKKGRVEVTGFYKNGVQDSIWKQYDSLGNLTLIRDKRKSR